MNNNSIEPHSNIIVTKTIKEYSATANEKKNVESHIVTINDCQYLTF
ncbi:MAG TPA: hypothetical protein K8V88_00350 [Companilactobacillus farciminis]|uniref:Uncharacterized protein n=2 Tax=Lactobacillaceae TaxID=33958 RepID=A0A921HNQ6_9LACO|nr:hypothetical protein [Lactobacillus kitasatonis]MBL1071260.1 hypothetical protein [Lactobacillus kitasatonis]HJF85867.1 hypothetical protein [Companilactobacillus farciminis]